MSLTGRRKAAMLLMSLDAATASELLKGVDTKMIQELALELAYLDAAGYQGAKEGPELVLQFCNSLEAKKGLDIKGLLTEILKAAVGMKSGRHNHPKRFGLVPQSGPFMAIWSADSRMIASVLEGEHPQAAAVVLSELPATKSSEVLGLLREGIQLSTINRMTSCNTVTAEARLRIGEAICQRLGVISTGADRGGLPARRQRSSRRVAVVLQNFGRIIRDSMFGTAQEKGGEVGERAADPTMAWEHIPQVADKSLQEVLRGIEPEKLALALVKADEQIARKIRANISERAAAMTDEQLSLMSTPSRKDVEGARKEIVKILCEMNGKGGPTFVEEWRDV